MKMKMNRKLVYDMARQQALAEIHEDGRWADAKELAKKENLPVAYCNKVLVAQRRAGKSYRLTKPLDDTSARELAAAQEKTEPESS